MNFTKASEELLFSTPTVTHHIKNLEEELNTVLFIRTSRMVKLTEAGTMFYNDAKEIMSKIDIAEKRIRKMAKQNSAFIRIGCSSNGELACLESVLHNLQIKYPHVYPQIVVNDYFSLRSLFNNKQLDIVLVTKEMTKDMQDCTLKKMKEIINYAVVSEKSALKNRVSVQKLRLGDLMIVKGMERLGRNYDEIYEKRRKRKGNSRQAAIILHRLQPVFLKRTVKFAEKGRLFLSLMYNKSKLTSNSFIINNTIKI